MKKQHGVLMWFASLGVLAALVGLWQLAEVLGWLG